MPPASLPAIPAMSPGPMTARNATRPRLPRNRPRRRSTSPAASRSRTRRNGHRMRTGRLAPRTGGRAAPAGVVDDRDREQVVAGDDPRDVVMVGQDADDDGLVDHDLADGRRGSRDDEVAQRQDPDEAALAVDDVDVVDGLGVGLELAQPVDRGS